MKFNISIPQKQIDKAYQQALKKISVTTTIKGFRKGKAPENLVEEKVGKTKIQNQALEQLIPDVYLAEIKKRKLQPIAYPQITPKTVEKKGEWIFEVEVAEKPEIKLGRYQENLKSAFSKSKIWTPDQKPISPDQKHNDHQHSQEDTALKLIFDTLLDTCKLEIPELLIDRETDRMLSKLLDQINQLGVNLDEYTKSIGKTSQQLREEYKKTALDNLKLEFLLQEIAFDLKIDVTDSEVEELINQVPDEKTKKQLQTDSSKLNLKLVLLKRKTVEKLEQIAKS